MGQTCAVCCKLPSGLIVDHGKTVMQDGKPKVTPEGQVVRENVQQYFFKGSNDPSAHGTGYGLTPDVDLDWFLDWTAQNADFPPVRDGLIFANAKPESAASQAKDRKDVKTGFDPVDAESAEFQAPGVKLEKADGKK